MRITITWILVAAALGGAGFAWSKRSAGKHTTVISEPLAKVGGKAIITVADYKARLAAQPVFALARYKTLERKKEFLDGLIRSELLLQEARRRHLEEDPEVRAAMEGLLIHKLARAYADEDDQKNPAPDADLRAYYDRHRSEFVSPTRVRASHVFLAAAEKGDARARARATAEAEKLLRQVTAREAKGEKQALELTASQRSLDLTTKATGGDLGFRTREELAQAWGAPFADAAFALQTPGALGPVVTSPKGIHLIKLLGRHEGYETSFEAARARIAPRLATERRARSVDQLAADLRKKAAVEIDETLLAKTNVEPTPGPLQAAVTPAP